MKRKSKADDKAREKELAELELNNLKRIQAIEEQYLAWVVHLKRITKMLFRK